MKIIGTSIISSVMVKYDKIDKKMRIPRRNLTLYVINGVYYITKDLIIKEVLTEKQYKEKYIETANKNRHRNG